MSPVQKRRQIACALEGVDGFGNSDGAGNNPQAGLSFFKTEREEGNRHPEEVVPALVKLIIVPSVRRLGADASFVVCLHALLKLNTPSGGLQGRVVYFPVGLLRGRFELDGSMLDPEFAGEDGIDFFEKRVRVGRRANAEVGAQGFFSARDGPNVEVADFLNA